jgi:hypothetical protein
MDPSEVILWSEVKRGYPSKCERVTVVILHGVGWKGIQAAAERTSLDSG